MKGINATTGVGLVLNDAQHAPHLVPTLYQSVLHLQEERGGHSLRGREWTAQFREESGGHSLGRRVEGTV